MAVSRSNAALDPVAIDRPAMTAIVRPGDEKPFGGLGKISEGHDQSLNPLSKQQATAPGTMKFIP